MPSNQSLRQISIQHSNAISQSSHNFIAIRVAKMAGASSSDDKLCGNLNKNTITIADIEIVEKFCFNRMRDADLYDLQNTAKLRAVNSTSTYEEFKDIVDAAHLRPLDKADKRNAQTKMRLWNSSAQHWPILIISQPNSNSTVRTSQVVDECVWLMWFCVSLLDSCSDNPTSGCSCCD